MRAILSMVLLVCCISSANGQVKQQPTQSSNTAKKEIAGSKGNPLFIQRYKSPDEKAEEDKQAADAKENLKIQQDTFKVGKDSLIANQAILDQAVRATWAAIIAAVAASIATLVAAGQLVMFWRQLGHMRKSNETAANAAMTAFRQTQIMMDAERAYVGMSHLPPGFYALKEGGQMMVDIEIRNHGNTPATITDIVLGHIRLRKGTALPIDPPYRIIEGRKIQQVSLYKDGFVNVTDTVNFLSAPTMKESLREMAKAKSDDDFYMIGYVDYIDNFNRRYRVGYARKHDPEPPIEQNNLNLVIEANYNYDRERDPNEGIDWTSDAETVYRERKKAKAFVAAA